jgi:hypothetical protein
VIEGSYTRRRWREVEHSLTDATAEHVVTTALDSLESERIDVEDPKLRRDLLRRIQPNLD